MFPDGLHSFGSVIWSVSPIEERFLIWPFYFWAGTLFFIGIYFLFVDENAFLSEGERRLKNARIREISALKSAPNGQAVKARIEGSPLVNAPVSGSVCLWYSFSIWEVTDKYTSRRPTKWTLLVREVEFSKHAYLEDNTGRCEISLRHAKIIKRPTEVGCSGFLDPVNENEKKILDQYQISSTNFLGANKELHFEETVILGGEPVVVSGRCEPINEAGFGSKKFETDTSISGSESVFVFGADYLPRNVRLIKYSLIALCLASGFFACAAYIQMVPEWCLFGYVALSAILGAGLFSNRDGT
jgi:hypothetical protein